jgi:hypothetical protein
MAGAIVIVVLLVVVFPVGMLMSMALLAGGLGSFVGRDRDLDNVTDDGEPNEYLALSDANPWAEGGTPAAPEPAE